MTIEHLYMYIFMICFSLCFSPPSPLLTLLPISTSLSSSSHQTSSLELKSGLYMLIYSQYCNIARLVCPKNHTYPLIKV